jgi:hypothetical protein
MGDRMRAVRRAQLYEDSTQLASRISQENSTQRELKKLALCVLKHFFLGDDLSFLSKEGFRNLRSDESLEEDLKLSEYQDK